MSSSTRPSGTPVLKTSSSGGGGMAGHRVSVSNLHPVATHEDIKELFGNIGPTASSKMIRPGTAIVVFHNIEHATK